jgi:2'-5' RNA ligase
VKNGPQKRRHGERRIRAFIALEVTAPLKELLQGWQKAFRRGGDRVGWVQPAGMHLTLKFLGDVEDGMVPKIAEQIQRACLHRAPFSVTLQGAGVFPGVKRPRVLWVGIGEGREQVKEIFQDLDPLLGEIGFPRETRPFHPHVTLGRIKGLEDRAGFAARVVERRETEVGTMRVEAVHLIESRLRPQGAEYQTLRLVPLMAEGESGKTATSSSGDPSPEVRKEL